MRKLEKIILGAITIGVAIDTFGVIVLWLLKQPVASPELFSIFQLFVGIVYATVALCLYFLFKFDQNQTFRVGWTLLLFFLGFFMLPVFWLMRVKPRYGAI